MGSAPRHGAARPGQGPSPASVKVAADLLALSLGDAVFGLGSSSYGGNGLVMSFAALQQLRRCDRVRDSDLETAAGIKAREVFLCGPKGLMDLATDLLAKRGLKEKQMHSTFFAPPAQASLDSDQLGGEVTFSNSNLKVGSEGDANLLEIAEAAGLKPQ